jgi:microcompartment protein CcmK/EutM
MILCKVTGTVTAPQKDIRFEGSKLLIVQPVDTAGEATKARDMLALDPRFDAGVGDYVLVAVEGAVVEQLMETEVPSNVIIVGVVDGWEVG